MDLYKWTVHCFRTFVLIILLAAECSIDGTVQLGVYHTTPSVITSRPQVLVLTYSTPPPYIRVCVCLNTKVVLPFLDWKTHLLRAALISKYGHVLESAVVVSGSRSSVFFICFCVFECVAIYMLFNISRRSLCECVTERRSVEASEHYWILLLLRLLLQLC